LRYFPLSLAWWRASVIPDEHQFWIALATRFQ
jgi:hypothetical protein